MMKNVGRVGGVFVKSALGSEEVRTLLEHLQGVLADGDEHSPFQDEFLTGAAALRLDSPADWSRIREAVAGPMKVKRAREWQSFARTRAKELEKARVKLKEVDEALSDVPDPRVRLDRGDEAELARHLLADLEEEIEKETGQLIETVFDGDKFYRYRGAGPHKGQWQPVEDAALSCHLQDYAGAPVGHEGKVLRLSATGVAGATKLAKHLRTDKAFFASAANGLLFRDAFVHPNVEEAQVEALPPDPSHRCRYGLGVPFAVAVDELAERRDRGTSRWLQYLEEVFEPDEDSEDKVLALQQFAGAALTGIAPTYQKALLLIGEGANGKSVFLKVLKGLLPESESCSISPQAMGDNFKLAHLGFKRLNIVNELPDDKIAAGEGFKMAVDGNEFTASAKNKPERTYRAVAGHAFGANTLPRTRDLSGGFWRRWLIIEFNRIFSEAESERNLERRLLREEGGLILAWAIEGLGHLLKQGAYTVPASSRHRLARWQCRSNSVQYFVENYCSDVALADEPGTATTELYKAYKRFCIDYGHSHCALQTFGQRLTRLGFDGVRKQVDGDQRTRRQLWLSDRTDELVGF